MKSTTMSPRVVTTSIRKAVATSRAVTQAPLHYRALQMAHNLVIPESKDCLDKYNSQVTLTSEGSQLVGNSRQTGNGSTNMSLTTCDDHRIRNLTPWVGSKDHTSWSTEDVVKHINFL